MAPALAQFERTYKDKVQIVEINLDENKPEAQQYQRYKTSQYIPETVVIRDGKAVAVKVGGLSLQQLVELVKP